jgi:hypothetical protein
LRPPCQQLGQTGGELERRLHCAESCCQRLARVISLSQGQQLTWRSPWEGGRTSGRA